MTITNRNSALYLSAWVNKYVQDARDILGAGLIIPFSHTVVSGETGGASANVQDTVNLCVLPANCLVVGFNARNEAMGASAGVGCTFDIGDSGDSDRYASIDVDAAGATESLLFTGLLYKPSADTIVLGKWKVANPIVGKIIKGFFLVAPAG